MKVYVVEWAFFDGGHGIEGIFSTPELAAECMRRFDERERSSVQPAWCSVSEHAIDAPLESAT